MKRKTSLYNDLLKYEHILDMVKVVSKNSKDKKEALRFKCLQNTNIFELQMRLYKRAYSFSKYHIFLIKYPKYRVIMSENIYDKVVNHLVSRHILLPSIEPCCIDTNVATRKDKGSKHALDKFYQYVNKIGACKDIYALKIDISKYFYSINHKILLNKLKKRIKDADAINIIKNILNTTNEDYINDRVSLLINNELKRIKNQRLSKKDLYNKEKTLNSIPKYEKYRGLPIGNMTSQILAIFYLNDVDHFIKEQLKCKYYIRYMDDLVILSTDKNQLKSFFDLIKNKIQEEDLKVNDKSNIYSLKNGVSFLGYTFKTMNGKLKVRYNNLTIHKINGKLRRKKKEDFNVFLRSKASYKGYFKRCNTALYYKKYRKMEVNNMYEKYLELKEEFPYEIIFLKKGKFYRTFDEDAIILSYLLEYQMIDNKVGFPVEGLFKVKNKLRAASIFYLILDGDKINHDHNLEVNNYQEMLQLSYKKYDRNAKIEELAILVKEKLESDIANYDKLKELISNLND